MGKKLQFVALYATCGKKWLSVRTMAKEINIEGPETVNIYVAQNSSRYFKEGDTSLKDKLRPGRPSIVKSETLLEIVEQQSHTSTCTL